MSNPFGSFGGALGSFGNYGNATSGGMSNALSGAGDATSEQYVQQGPDMNVSWEDLTGSKNFGQYADLYNDLPNQAVNYSDAVIDWGKYGVNRTMPRGGYDYEAGPTPYGDFMLSGNNVMYKNSPLTRAGSYDRDPTETMGMYDPRVQLIMNDAEGWNDPLANWLQKRGALETMNTIGNLNYRATNGDSSAHLFDPQRYYVQKMGADAADILNADPDSVARVQSGWHSSMTPGAQSARDDAMFGGGGVFGGLGSFLGPLATLGSFVPGPWTPFAQAYNLVNAVDNENWLGAIGAGVGLSGGFSGFGGFEGAPTFDLPDGGVAFGGYDVPTFDLPDGGVIPGSDIPMTASGDYAFDDAVGQSGDPDSLWNSATREYNQFNAENPLAMKTVKGLDAMRKQLAAQGMREDQIEEYIQNANRGIDERQAARSAAVSNIPERRRINPAFGNQGMWS